MKTKTIHAIMNSREVQRELEKTNAIRSCVYDVLSSSERKSMSYANKSLIARAIGTKLAIARDDRNVRVMTVMVFSIIAWLVSLAYAMYGVSMLNFVAACVAAVAVFALGAMYAYRSLQAIADTQLLAVETMSVMAIADYISNKYGSEEIVEIANNVLGNVDES